MVVPPSVSPPAIREFVFSPEPSYPLSSPSRYTTFPGGTMYIRTCLGVVAMVLLSTNALSQRTGDWNQATFDGGVYAATVNDSGNLLGQYCFAQEESCVWLLGLSARCDEGHEYPVLVTSDLGAQHMYIKCGSKLDSDHYQYFLTSFDEVDKMIRGAIRIGFALPMQNDEFQVVRFSLSGARPTLDSMRKRASALTKQPTPQTPTRSGTKNQRL